jgi:hypothetical protein
LQPTITSVTGKCARTEMEGNPNYFPNSFDEMQIDQAYKDPFEVNSRFATGTIVIVKGKRSFLPIGKF